MGLLTYLQFKNTLDRYNKERSARKEQNVMEFIDYEVAENNISITNYLQKMPEIIYKISDIRNIDIVLYDLNGKFIAKTSKTLPSNNLKKEIYSKINIKVPSKEINIEEKINKENTIINSYNLILDPHSQPLAIVDIVYYNNSKFLVESFNSLFTSLAIIFIFLFICCGFIAWFLSQNITKKLKTVSNKLKETQVITRTEPIEYSSNDEIKPLVDSYNLMLFKLKEQTNILTQQERSDAWEDMAKQVAHEIKNPLTPMKLMIQNFERKYDPNDVKNKEKVQILTSALLQQIETINEITDAFSDFAKMPIADNSELDVVKVVTNTIDIFSSYHIDFKTNKPDIIRVMDNIHLSRVITNLLKNAIQSEKESEPLHITVTLFEDDEKLLISIKDNGKGISETIKNKIFEPKFTTKNSGMGLGLAMVKKIINDYNGKIWFETKENEGTTFFIELPNI